MDINILIFIQSQYNNMIHFIILIYYYIKQINFPSSIPRMRHNDYSQRNIQESDKLTEESLDKHILKLNEEILKKRYLFPGSKKLALVHQNAAKFGGSPISYFQKCPCCQNYENKKNFNLCEKTLPDHIMRPQSSKQSESHQRYFEENKSFQMNSGTSMFFFFILVVIAYLIIQSVLVQSYNIVTNFNNNNNQNSNQTIWIKLSLLNKQSDYGAIQTVEVLSTILVVLSIGFFIFLRKIKYMLWKKIDISRQTEDDYAIFVEKIPIIGYKDGPILKTQLEHDIQLERFLKDKIHNWLQDSLCWENPSQGSIEYDYTYKLKGPDIVPSDTIKSISLCYDITLLQRLRSLRVALMQKHRQNTNKYGNIQITQNNRYDLSSKQNSEMRKNLNKLNIIPNQIKQMNQAQMLLCKQMALNHNFIEEASRFLGCAFVSFKYQHYRDIILEMAEMNPELMEFQGERLRISEAYNPSQVRWENLYLTDSDRKKRVITTILITSLVLLVTFALLIGIYFLTFRFQSSAKKIRYYSISLISTIIVVFIGYIIQLVIYELVYWEKHKTITNAKFSLVFKLVSFQFINNAMVYFILFYIAGGNVNNMKQRFGLINQVSWLLVVSASLRIVFNFLDISSILRKITLWWKLKSSSSDQVYEFQNVLNKQYELQQFDIAIRYSYYIVQLFTASFYAYLIPIGIPILAIVFSIQYWLQKFNLFKKSSMKYVVNYKLTRRIFQLFQASILFYCLGMFIFSTIIHEGLQVFPTISLGCSALYILIIQGIPQKYIKIIFESYIQLQEYEYDDNVKAGKFIHTYWNQNPVTSLLIQKEVTSRIKVANNNRSEQSRVQWDQSLIQTKKNKRKSNINPYEVLPTE